MNRKMLAAREDLVDNVSELAVRRGLTLFGITNEALEQVLKLDALGRRLSDVVREYEVLKAAKDAGFVLVPESLLYEVMEKIYSEDREWMIKKWFETGEWCGKCYAIKDFSDKISSLENDLRFLFWNAREFDITREGGDAVHLRCVSPRFTESYTNFLCAFLEGVFCAIGYACVERHVAKGFIKLKFCQMKEEVEGRRLKERGKAGS